MTENTGSYTGRAMATTTRMPLSIRETPQSVTVITSQLMEDRQISDVIDIVEHTTGLSINRYESNRGSMFARGFKIENYLIDGIQSSIDEQWSAGEILTSTALYDHVEVLRGSDGLMIGTGNPSGVINLIRKRADSDVFTGNVSVKGGSWSHYGGTVDINTPISKDGTTRVRLVADYDKRGHYIDRMENRTFILYGTVEQDIGENTLFSAGVSHQDSRSESPTWGGAPAWTVDSNDQVIRLGLDRSFNPAPDWTYWNSKYTTLFARAEHDFGGGWKASASYTRGERDSESKIALFYPRPISPDTGQSFQSFFGFIIPTPGYAGKYFVENIKNDVNIQVNGDVNLLGRAHKVVFGYDRSQENFDADGAPGSITLANTPNIFNFNGKSTEPTYLSPPNNYKNHIITQNAFYVAGRISIADPLTLIVGTRMIDYDVEDVKDPINSFKAENKFVPYAGLVFSPIKNVSLYASYTSIFQPQRYRDENNKLLSPIEGNTYEGGIKGEFWDGRLNASLSVYRMEQKNIGKYDRQVPEDPAFPNGPKRLAYVTLDGVVSKGFEAEISGEILPKWNITAGYSQFKTRENEAATSLTTQSFNSLIPRRQFNLFTSYVLPGALEALTIGGGVRWQSSTYSHPLAAQAAGVPRLEQGAYLIADLMARYQISDGLSAQLNVNNLLDKKYFAPTDDGMQIFWQEPRSFQIRLKYQF